ncbi:MAG TPA: phosphatidate cytidylyltransferase [Steroidobacteraceae bacterium]|nr:phosphatidate cytidylyltransferase [Steroidobacteraceae bacterium]
MLRTRILTAAILACILLAGLFLLPPPWAVLAIGATFTVGAWEWAGFGALRGTGARTAYAAGVAVLLVLAWRWTAYPKHLMLLLSAACAWWAIALLWLSWGPPRHHPTLALACGLPVLVPAFIALARLQVAAQGFAGGPQMVLWLVLLVIAADVGAYFAGRSLGRRKLAPRVSPGKTWEGAMGGLLMVALVAWAGAAYFGLPPLAVVVFGCAVGVFSIIGDLTESMFKRAAGLKDSGALLPGHGGLLDRIDSVTAAAPLYALGLFSHGVIA